MTTKLASASLIWGSLLLLVLMPLLLLHCMRTYFWSRCLDVVALCQLAAQQHSWSMVCLQAEELHSQQSQIVFRSRKADVDWAELKSVQVSNLVGSLINHALLVCGSGRNKYARHHLHNNALTAHKVPILLAAHREIRRPFSACAMCCTFWHMLTCASSLGKI